LIEPARSSARGLILRRVQRLRQSRRSALLGAVLAAAVCGAGAAAALLLLANRGVVASVTAKVVDDTYARLRPHPRVIEPVAGDVAGVATQVPSPQAVEPRAGAVQPGGQGASPGAPSDAEVRRELAQVQRAQRAAKVAPAFQNPAGVGPVAPFEPAAGWHTSVASVFTDYGKPVACGGVLAPNELGVAHKSAPCGALITFRYNGRVVRVPVIDRGPYIPGREWDLTGATAQLLGFPGLDFIEWTV
jgi:Lytic transglycolase